MKKDENKDEAVKPKKVASPKKSTVAKKPAAKKESTKKVAPPKSSKKDVAKESTSANNPKQQSPNGKKPVDNRGPKDRKEKFDKGNRQEHKKQNFTDKKNSELKGHRREPMIKDKMAPTLDIAELQRKDMEVLVQMGKVLGIEGLGALEKPDLIFEILKANAEQSGLMYGSGHLEVLSDGFGFLRSKSYCYLPSPEDIYLSPSQIRRFALKTGDFVAGQMRAPRQNERFFAM